MALMNKILISYLSVFLTVNAAEIHSPENGGDLIPNSYIIVMKEGITSEALANHQAQNTRPSTGSLAASQTKIFDFQHFKGYSGVFDDASIKKIARDPSVKYIERDQIVRAQRLIEQPGVGWNLARISHKARGATSYVYDESAGDGISVCLVDTGVNVTNPDLIGRATWGANYADDKTSDGNGHGTFLASLIAGTKYGVAKKSRIISVKVLGDNGSGSYSNVIAGMNWCVQNAKERGATGKTVMNLSIGGRKSQAVNDAAESAVRAGLFVVAAVGGENRDARDDSPASAQGVCAVAASSMDDKSTPFSNYGKTVAIWAPGQNIQALDHKGRVVTYSGVSFAAGHVSGVGAYLLRLEGLPGDKVCARIKELANPVISNPPPNTTTLLLYNGSGR